jgi:hypothetical protein
MKYTLSFYCALNSHDESIPIKAEWIEEAMNAFQDSSIWYNYLVSAVEFSLSEDGGEGQTFPEITDIEITLGEPTNNGTFYGTISWSALEVDIETLEEKLEWFIGDRMSFYEVENDEEGWNCFVTPGDVCVE